MSTSKNWERVQKIEQSYHEQKDPATALEFQRAYWSGLLEALPDDVVIDENTRVLDVGCGGTSILLMFDRGQLTGVDPLMDFYLEKFPTLHEAPVRWLKTTTESLEATDTFDVIFSINMLDHTADPRASAKNLANLLADGGRLVLLLNVHLTRFWRLYYSLFYRFVDPPHPHQFLRDDVPDMFGGLQLVDEIDVAHVWLELREDYQRRALGRKKNDRSALIKKLLNPFQYPIGIARYVFKWPMHGKRPGDRSLMTTVMYVFVKEPTASS